MTAHARRWGRYRKFVASATAQDPVEPFIDPEGYRAYIDAAEAEFRQGWCTSSNTHLAVVEAAPPALPQRSRSRWSQHRVSTRSLSDDCGMVLSTHTLGFHQAEDRFGMFDDKDLMRLHVEALFICDKAGRLLTVNDPGGVAAPRFFFGRTADRNAWWFRDDVDGALASELHAICETQPTGLEVEGNVGNAAAPFIACLSRVAPVRETWAGPAFRFPPDLRGHETAVRVTSDNAEGQLSPYFQEWRRDVSGSALMVVVLEEGKAVSLCCSVRVTSQVHEAGVETHPNFRGRGHAARAVNAWAKVVREIGRTPLYSTSWKNQSSRALANKLGLIQYGVDLHIT